ncbi:MAG: hypothetical protein RIS70_3933 [Planctomycetota bacterium]|jgi:DUF1009 family protein
MASVSDMTAASRVGLVAGWGRFPVVVAEAIRRQGHELFCLGIRDHADARSLAAICSDYHEVGLAQLGAAIRYFRRHDISQATMAGKIHKVRLFHRFAWLRHIPDWTCLKTFYPHFIRGNKDRRDDTLLLAIVQAYADAGIRFAPATDFAPELLVKLGQLAGPPLTELQRKDVEFGWRLAKEMGRLDVGQTVVVKGQAILAVEAIEGTDECIRRAGVLCTAGGFTVVKVAKPQQDMRFDVPTIGLGTLETIATAGGRVLAIEADKTVLVDQDPFVARAKQLKIAVVAVEDPTPVTPG